MKIFPKISILSVIVFASFLITKNSLAVGLTEINSDISTETTWTKGDSPYVVSGVINVNSPLTIEPGVVVKFSNEAVNNATGTLIVKSLLSAIGTPTEKIVFTSTSDSSYGGDTSSYSAWWSNSSPRRGDWSGINLSDNSGNITIENAIFSYASRALSNQSIYNKEYYKGLNIKNSEIVNNVTGIYLRDVEPVLENNSIHDNNTGIKVYTPASKDRIAVIKNSSIYNNGNAVDITAYKNLRIEYLDARNNWWGDASGPYSTDFNPDGKGNRIIGNWNMFIPWSNKYPIDEVEDVGCQENCYSNVLFLPGIKASHLYKYNSETDKALDELWVPNWFGNDIEELALNSDGTSKEKVFTKEGDVLKNTIMGSLYESFLTDLENLKISNTIVDYKAFAYDWRQNVEDIITNGTPYENETTKSVVTEIINLAKDSKSKKVTIVAHSNGGLVTKAAMIELEKLNLADKVDKIIFVGTPQMGTPLATLSFLYGYEESLPTLLSQKDARSLIENMPGAYGLLPSDKYLTRLSEVGESLINFSSENSERGKMFRKAYGEKIDNYTEFKNFLLAEVDKREKPEKDEIDLENILNPGLLNQAISTHNNLDNWTPPASVKVVQLGGWGLPTVSGINYVEKKEASCFERELSELPICAEEEGQYALIPEPKFTVDGDRVVTTPSGLMMSEKDNVNRYWFDVKRYSEENEKIEHGNILEATDIRNFIKNEIQNNVAVLSDYISDIKPNDYQNAEPQIRMSLYSPLDIHLYSGGNHTGYNEIDTDEGKQRILEENIPNSYYFQLGERKYVGFEKGEDVTIKLDGYDKGAYTLKIEEVVQTEDGEEVINHITFKNLPASENTQVELTVPEDGLEEMSDLQADYNDDGINDYVLESVLGEEITLDTIPPVIEITSPQNKTYLKNEQLNINFEVSDDKTSEDKIQIEKLLDNEMITQNIIDLSLLKTGEHKLIIKAVDETGNKGEKEIVFNISTDIRVLKNNINHYYDLKLIKTSSERKMIINNLSIIEGEIELYKIIKNNIFIKSKIKKILLNAIENQIQNHIEIVIKKIEQDKKNYVTIIKSIIIDDLEFIKNNIK